MGDVCTRNPRWQQDPFEPHHEGPPQGGLLGGREPVDKTGHDPFNIVRGAAVFQPEQGGGDVAQARQIGLGVAALFQQKLPDLRLPVAQLLRQARLDQVG